MAREPDFQLNVYLVPYGFQADILFGGHEISMMARDFADSYEVEDLQRTLRKAVITLLHLFSRDPTMEEFLDAD